MVRGVIVLLLYFGVCFYSYSRMKNPQSFAGANGISSSRYESVYSDTKLSYPTIFLVACLFAALDFISLRIGSGYGSDLINYRVEYGGARDPQSYGLKVVFLFFNFLNAPYEVFLTFSSFFYVFMTLIAFNVSGIGDRRLFLYLFASEWFFFSITALKQAYSASFAMLFFAVAFKDRTKKSAVMSLVFALLAFLFHSTGFVLLILFPFIRKKKYTALELLLITIAFAFLFLFIKEIVVAISPTLSVFAPNLASKLIEYFATRSASSERWFVFLKFIPFYFISLFGFIMRKKLCYQVANYDNYLIVSVFSSFIIASSISYYWFYRFMDSLYFPYFTFFLVASGVHSKKHLDLANLFVLLINLFFSLRNVLLIFINYGGF